MAVLYPSATRTDIVVQLGDTYTITFPVLDQTGALISMSGWAARAQVRHAPGSPLLYEWNTTAGAGIGVATCTSAGVVLAFDGTVTDLWTWRQDSAFDLFVFEPSTANPHCVATGRFRVIPSVTA